MFKNLGEGGGGGGGGGGLPAFLVPTPMNKVHAMTDKCVAGICVDPGKMGCMDGRMGHVQLCGWQRMGRVEPGNMAEWD